MRALVLVLASRRSPYPLLVRTIKRTWASVPVDGVETLFYYGGPRTRLEADELVLPVPDDLAHAGQKTLACFEHVLAHRRFDLVFRTNCSSYVDLPNLKRYMQEHARAERFYAGVVSTHGPVTFASGSGYFLSRDLVELVLAERAAWDHALLDDLALAAVLARHGVHPERAPRVDYTSPREVGEVDTSQFHFRCKTPSRLRLDDVETMVELHRAFCRERRLRLSRATTSAWLAVRALRVLARLPRQLRGMTAAGGREPRRR